jgi:DNA-binding response OmpR family regulator
MENNLKRVLVIEDERFIGELYKRALEKAGYSVDILMDGQQGLQAALTDVYDVILLDIMVPQILGIDVLQRLRTEKPDLKAKIIIATNLQQDEAARAEIEKSADGYLIKAEITPRQLVGTQVYTCFPLNAGT